jgi:hypothetical protein
MVTVRADYITAGVWYTHNVSPSVGVQDGVTSKDGEVHCFRVRWILLDNLGGRK